MGVREPDGEIRRLQGEIAKVLGPPLVVGTGARRREGDDVRTQHTAVYANRVRV